LFGKFITLNIASLASLMVHVVALAGVGSPTSSGSIGGPGEGSMSRIVTSLAVLENATSLAATIPYIGAIACIIRHGFAIQSVSVSPLFYVLPGADNGIRRCKDLRERAKP
jgi:hypothetical protein